MWKKSLQFGGQGVRKGWSGYSKHSFFFAFFFCLKDVRFNHGVILRRFYKIGVNFSENVIFKKMQLNGFQGKTKRAVFF